MGLREFRSVQINWILNCLSFTDDGTPLIKPYQFKMSEIEGFRYRAKVRNHEAYIPSVSMQLTPRQQPLYDNNLPRLKINLSSGKKRKWILAESNKTYTECSRLQINVICQTILVENVYWLSNEHSVQCLLLYQDWAKFIMILMTPEPCSKHQYLHATWSTFSDPFHTFSSTMQSHDQNSQLSLKPSRQYLWDEVLKFSQFTMSLWGNCLGYSCSEEVQCSSGSSRSKTIWIQ